MIKVILLNSSIMEIGRFFPRDKKKAEQDRRYSQSATGKAFGWVLLSFPESRLFHRMDF